MFAPTFHFRLKKEVTLICALSAACLALMLIVRIVAQYIEKNIRPRQVPQYLSLRNQMKHEQGIEESNLLSTFAPPYKWHKQLVSSTSFYHKKAEFYVSRAWPGMLSFFLLGTTFPTKHQQLFLCWARGPEFLIRSFEVCIVDKFTLLIEKLALQLDLSPYIEWSKQASCFFQLIVLALWTNLMRSHVHTWFHAAPWGIPVMTGIFCLQCLCLSGTLYLVLFCLHAGMLIDARLLEKASYSHVNCIHAHCLNLTTIRSRNVSSEEKNRVLVLWANLDEEQLGEIDRFKVYHFLLSQGLHLSKEDDADQFLQMFDRSSKGGLNKDEFFILFSVVQQILQEPLDKETLQVC
ncbi:hypothetical protein IE077_001391 [Cardiosporidium cionae]|uniref:EF-hand domain-containing protein n=1 Tax=Cardiosporidium cionae TaxID=476202 RepID=A0ABQ7JG66_9APIC|nr:hypothetical protein IE077_001391 [Cardiosporidium cionae]|eukprot:KAF8823012.1 hypothetical protein IE077_001391 [Cardiosporidium cionae]